MDLTGGVANARQGPVMVRVRVRVRIRYDADSRIPPPFTRQGAALNPTEDRVRSFFRSRFRRSTRSRRNLGGGGGRAPGTERQKRKWW